MNFCKTIVATVLLAVAAVHSDAWGNSSWSFNVGLAHGESHRLQMGISTMPFSDFDAGFLPSGIRIPAEIGATQSVDDRNYEDGYVSLSRSGNTVITTTENPITTFWGYQRSNQIVDGFLVYQAQGEETTSLASDSRQLNNAAFPRETQNKTRPVIEIGRHWDTSRPEWRMGLVAGVSWFSHSQGSGVARLMDYSQDIEVRQATVTDRYDIGSIVVPVAPYNGPEAPPGPVIDNLPTSRTVEDEVLSSETRYFVGYGDLYSRIKSQQFSLGLRFNWLTREAKHRTERSGSAGRQGFALALAGAGLDVGLLVSRTDLQLTEGRRIVETDAGGVVVDPSFESHTAQQRERRGLVGSYAGISGKLALDQHFSRFLKVGIRYEDGGSFTVTAGDSRADLRLGGWTFRSSIEVHF